MLDLPLRVVKEAILSPLAAILPPHPNAISIVVDAIAVTDSQVGFLLVSFWILNRIVDGVDGTVARKYSMQTDYGGYLDIIVDFTVYASIPIALCIGYHQSVFALAIVAALEGIYFVNCASLFQLSAILEKRSQGSKSKKELTTVTMPPALIEGTETLIFYTLFILFPAHAITLFQIFGGLVTVSIIQRVMWAFKNIR